MNKAKDNLAKLKALREQHRLVKGFQTLTSGAAPSHFDLGSPLALLPCFGFGVDGKLAWLSPTAVCCSSARFDSLGDTRR